MNTQLYMYKLCQWNPSSVGAVGETTHWVWVYGAIMYVLYIHIDRL